MENRKWLWKERSSRKRPGETGETVETESSGSVSSHSERYSDDQETFKTSPNDNIQSPEISSMASANCEDVSGSVKSLTEKLSAALVNISAKEDLVKQHAKVAEEAIAGWEKAENEVEVLKKKLDGATQKNSALEDRVSHLDGALKECVRQLRQGREEQEQKIRDAITKTKREWETTRFELESKLLELQDKAESVKSEPPSHSNPDTCHKIEALERENSALKIELLSQSEELEIRTIERDLSNQAAETASKQVLESIKKMGRLEAECRRLKAIASRSSVNDHRTTCASAMYVGSLMDSQSDSSEQLNAVDIGTHKMSCSDSWASALLAELDQFKNEKVNDRSLPASSIEITLMDDFLEMERLAALHENKSENQCVESETTSRQSDDAESSLRAELEAMVRLTAELEVKLENMGMENVELQEKLGRMEMEKVELEIALTKSQESIEASEILLRETEVKLEELQKELSMANESKQLLESQLISMEVETQTMSAKINLLEAEVDRQRCLADESKQLLESQLLSMEVETQTMSAKINLLEAEVDRERGLADESKQLLESQLLSMEAKTQMMSAKINLLEAEIERERDSSKQITVKFQELEEERSEKRHEAELQQTANSAEIQTMSAKINLLEAEVERERASSKKVTVKCQELEEELSRKRQEAELQQTVNSAETQTLSVKINLLEEEVEREKASSKQVTVKCQELEEELSRQRQEAELQKTANSNVEMKIKQEDLEVAAGKLADCQKTIASLGKQLKSLATLEDFLIDTASLPEFSATGRRAGGSLIPGAGGEPWKLHSNETYSHFNTPTMVSDNSVSSANKNNGNSPLSSSSSSSSSSSALSTNLASSEKNRNGFAKFFTRSKNGIHLEI